MLLLMLWHEPAIEYTEAVRGLNNIELLRGKDLCIREKRCENSGHKNVLTSGEMREISPPLICMRDKFLKAFWERIAEQNGNVPPCKPAYNAVKIGGWIPCSII